MSVPEKHRLGRTLDWTLAITGSIGVFISILDMFTDVESLLFKNVATVTLLMASAVAVSIGLEGRLRFSAIDERFDELRSMLAEAVDGTTEATGIEKAEDIYLKVMTIVSDARRMIRATAFGEPSSPKVYLETLCHKLQSDRSVVFRLVTGYAGTAEKPVLFPKKYRARSLQERKQIFESAGVWRQVFLRAAPAITAPDFIIVDEDSILILFPTVKEDPSLQAGIFCRNKPEIVRNIVRWYDEYLWGNEITISIDDDFLEANS